MSAKRMRLQREQRPSYSARPDLAVVVLTDDELAATLTALNRLHPTEPTHPCPGCAAKRKLAAAWPLDGFAHTLALHPSHLAQIDKAFNRLATCRKRGVVRIEERCGCGAEFVLLPEVDRYNQDRRHKDEKRAWAQVDRWRKLHAGCREKAAQTPVVSPGGPERG